MGNAAPSAEDGDHFAEFDGVETLGYRVLGVQPNSPASKAGLVSFFDFLVGANEMMLLGSGEGLDEGEEYDDVDFPAMLHESKGEIVELCKLLFIQSVQLSIICVVSWQALMLATWTNSDNCDC
jgi:hypothetical protein